jgi:23S rRNA (cytidine1920-2'-O)/16S rRNA (cytidine1409-2'-O)-methyltransferase
VAKHQRARFVALVDLLSRAQSEFEANAIAEGRVLVDGSVITNPRAQVRSDAAIRVLPVRRLRGDIKLSHAIDTLEVDVAGRVAIDVGASAGGFTTALLDREAARVYSVDAGTGQLVGRLRTDARVVNLDGTNIADLDRSLVPEVIDVVTMDLSYLSVARAIPQLERIEIGVGADLLALVKPTFELRRGSLAATDDDLATAVDFAGRALATNGWDVARVCDAPATGRHGAREAFVHAKRR